MRQIPVTYSLLTFLDDLTYLEAALSADPDAADLAAAVEEQIGQWDEVFAKERAGRRAVTRADAVVAVRNTELDRTTTRFAATALLEAGQDRNSPQFKRFFKSPPSALVRSNLRKQCEYTRDVILTEIAGVPAKSPLKPYAASLDKGLKAALVALDDRARAHGDRATGGTLIVEYKEGVNNLRTSTHAELIKRGVAKGFGRGWAETFFRPSSQTVETEDPAAPTPAPLPSNTP